MKRKQFPKIIWRMITAVASVVVLLLFSINAFATGDTTESEQTTDDKQTMDDEQTVDDDQATDDDIISIIMPVVSENDDIISLTMPTVSENGDIISLGMPTVSEDDAVMSLTVPTVSEDNDVISITRPVVSEKDDSVFDFILDPQGLVYSTNAARYGGGTVEEGATLLFHNNEEEYDFSGYSDRLTVTNQSSVPVQVTITARITGLEDIKIVEHSDFSEDTDPAVYFAIVDNKGNIQPLSTDGQASICLEMDMGYDDYSFGLTGACNSNADWQGISTHPVIEVIWNVEPIIDEQEDTSMGDDISAEEGVSVEEDASVEEDISSEEGTSVEGDMSEEEGMSTEEDIISGEDDASEDHDEIIRDDLHNNNTADDNPNGNKDENNGISEDQNDTGAGRENDEIDQDSIPDYDNSQNLDG